MSKFKPFLACDFEERADSFPLYALPKIDGVRGLNYDGTLTGRSLKPFANKHLTRLFSKPCYEGFDGELAAGDECDPDLCRKTSSASSTIEGEFLWTWHVFDLCADSVQHLPYEKRHAMLSEYVEQEQLEGRLMDLKVVPMVLVNNMNELLEQEAIWIEMGYEGVITRKPGKPCKRGRATSREGGYGRIKRFTDGEGVIIRINEGMSNQNEAQINELGQTFRSTHQDNMVPNGMIGSYVVTLLTVPENLPDHIKLKVGDEMTVGAGKLTHEERLYYFQNPDKFLGRISKFKFFLHGMKDKLRIPTHQSFRDPVDMS
jgi:DNA ligase-1